MRQAALLSKVSARQRWCGRQRVKGSMIPLDPGPTISRIAAPDPFNRQNGVAPAPNPSGLHLGEYNTKGQPEHSKSGLCRRGTRPLNCKFFNGGAP